MLKLQFRDRRQEPVWLVDNNFTVGRNKTNSLVIDEASISDHHAEIIQQGQRLQIKDLGASEGVFINGVRVIGEHQISPGNIIKLGNVELEIVDPQQTISNSPEEEAEWRLIATASWMNKQNFDITGTMVLGRDSSCDIAIPVEHLSRRHAELSIQGGKLVVKDLESANGTFVNGQKVDETILKPGDKLKFDVITFTIDGPDHDPNKTIIRSAKDFQKEIQEEIKKKAAQASAQPKPAAPRPAPEKKPIPVAPPIEKDEDSWLTEAPAEKSSNAPAIFFSVIAILAIAAGIGAYLLL